MVERLKKRGSPNAATISWRAQHLASLGEIATPTSLGVEIPQLERGNSKLGVSGRYAKTMFVWNLPAKATCPGASPWCSKWCYNADLRDEKFPLETWVNNWAWAVHSPDKLADALKLQLTKAAPPVAVRIHSSGDYFSADYIDFWIRIVSATPEVQYWCYTRSWTSGALLARLDVLRSLPNIQVFASWDDTMPATPVGWRRSVVRESIQKASVDAETLSCPEQDGRLPSCAACGYCFAKRPGGVLFDAH